MKKIFLMLLCVASVALVGCKGNEPEDQTPSSPEQSSLTGLPLVKKVFEQAKAADALATMRSSEYDSVRMEGGTYRSTYIYKSSADSISISINSKDTVEEAKVMYLYQGNVIGTTCLQYLETNLGGSITVQGSTLDSTYAYMITDKPKQLDQYVLPTTDYRLYKYQDIVDSIKADTKLINCEIWYHRSKKSESVDNLAGLFFCKYDKDANTTSMKVGFTRAEP